MIPSRMSNSRCSTSQTGDLTKPDRAIDEIFGFGQQGLSVIAQLSSQGIAPDAFSHCLVGNGGGGGILVLGQIIEPTMVYTPLIQSQSRWVFGVESVCETGLPKYQYKSELSNDFCYETERREDLENVKMVQEKENVQLKRINTEYEKIKLQLEDHEKKLRAREVINDCENKKLDTEKKMKKKEKLHQKIIDLQKKLDDKQRLELEIKQMKGAMEVMKHMTHEDVEAKKNFESIKDLKEKEEELEDLEELNQSLVIKERLINDELQDARKELISDLKEICGSGRAHIGVKRMGDLDAKPFIVDAQKRCLSREDTIKFLSIWEDHLRDLSWHPFKIITIGDDYNEMYTDNSVVFHTGYGYNSQMPYGPYSPVTTVLPSVNGDAQLYLHPAQQYTFFGSPYYQIIP
ncbi:unnamed protein product [Lactuca virosa]|uniref:Factor of DNA methylation 1-5/IDN2 domain-containing protein n=1 Tax=Lactuca virosa TaxID=75947 RepID=A0AAU9NEJ3_9ASTR|nr:unnamed protein product [Lactuca virosa]